jgi:hypothetical protein
MRGLYKRVEVDETTPVTYVGVYVLQWKPEWGEPSVAFMPATETEEDENELDELRAQLAQLTTDNTRLVCDYAKKIEECNALEGELAEAREAMEAGDVLDAIENYLDAHPLPKDRDASETP